MMIRAGAKRSITSFNAFPKSPTREQQMHPEFISVILTPASFKKPPSIPISPNSFSISTICSPANASLISFFINVVFPAPKKPEIISIFVIIFLLSIKNGAASSFSQLHYYNTYFLNIPVPILKQARITTKPHLWNFPKNSFMRLWSAWNTSSGVPDSATTPLSMNIILSDISLAKAISWVTITMAM